ncbi:hypothetical protein PybrP1_005727 [[Pythium] brassicae (nom. inval.)]|nr:hypothetical protein PybrP1_005727 [[Pythium] brassicae (nom. inval.)]
MDSDAAASAGHSDGPPTLRRSFSTGTRAMAALSTLAAQAKGLTATLPRPKFLTNAAPAVLPPPQTQSRPEKSLSASSLSTAGSATEETADESEEPPSANETTRASQRSRLGSEDTPSSGAAVVLMPWELHDASGDVMENAAVREKVLELAVYRRTFAEDATGEDEYTFQYARYKDVARRLLHSDPNLREKYAALVQSPASVLSEEGFWRNYFLRCNALRVDAGLPPYLPPVVLSSTAAVASFQRFKRDMFLKTQRSSAELEKLRRSLMQSRRGPGGAALSMDGNDPTAEDCELGELELDLDGEIERELVRRRPSRAVEYQRSSVSGT